MAQIAKTAPAFMFYASDMMADRRYRTMGLEERGLLLSILCECWVNRSMPSDAPSIGKWLSFPKEAIEAALTDKVLSFFDIHTNELTSPELERYRKELEMRRDNMSKGGKKGSKTRWDKPVASDNYPIKHPYGVSMGSRVEQRREEKRRIEARRYVRKILITSILG
ncbi:MAG: hypothetical protein M3Q16_04525 [Pseudomonadota bacterium]|nr:hypothetical protein [Pseudomonadota bacterium]